MTSITKKPIYSLLAPRHELGGARKGVIYLSKMLIGTVVWALLVFPFGAHVTQIAYASLAVFITTKVCYYVNTGDWPDPQTWYESFADWCCDGVLHLWWLVPVWWQAGHIEWALALIALWIFTYPWSAE